MSIESTGTTLPRRAVQQFASAPGVVTIPNTGRQVTSLARVKAGDLVFFDASDDGKDIDHMGMFTGVDSGGRHRFLSSRKTINGPTIGDEAGRSTLNGTGLYASAFRGCGACSNSGAGGQPVRPPAAHPGAPTPPKSLDLRHIRVGMPQMAGRRAEHTVRFLLAYGG